MIMEEWENTIDIDDENDEDCWDDLLSRKDVATFSLEE